MASKMPGFELPSLAENKNGWGPMLPVATSQFQDVPYAPFSKADNVSRIADWTHAAEGRGDQLRARGRNLRDQHQTYGSSATSAFTYQRADESSFSMVTTGTTSSKKTSRPAPSHAGAGQRGHGTRNRAMQRLGGAGQDRHGGRAGHGGFRKRQPWTGDRFYRQRYASVQAANDWELKQEISFSALAPLKFGVPEAEDVAFCGRVGGYDKKYDRIPARMPASLQKKSAVAYNVSASDDQVIEELAGAGKTRVFATDVVLATLMVAPRTVQPWDIVINRVEDRLYLDKRDGGPLDYLTVNENAVDPPSEGVDKSSINAPAMLAQEANEINRQFIAQVASNKAGGEKFERENPFVNEPEDDEKTVAAYRYRLFDLSAKQVVGEREGGAAGEEDNEEEGEEEADKCIMAVRTELNAVDKGPNDHEAYLFVRALNQFDPRAAGAGGALDWRTKMQSNRGAVVATERKNNSAKLAKWSLQAMMSDAAYLKLGYVGRADPSKRTAHKVYTVEKYKPTDLLKHLNVNVENAWGIAKAFIDLCLTLPEGRYVLVRDPIKPSMLLYAVPQGTFDNVDEDEDEDEEAGENVTSGGAVSGAGVSPAGKAL